MPHYKHTNKRDENDHEILDIFKRYGLPCVQGLPGQGFDYLVGFSDGVKLVEIKFPGREKLTEKERVVQKLFGDDFVVVTTAEEAIDLCVK